MNKINKYKYIICILLVLNLITLAGSYRTLNELNDKIYGLTDKVSKISSQSTQNTMIVYEIVEPDTLVELEPEHEVQSLGNYKLTAYCPCKKCCGNWSYEVTGKRNKTSSGTYPEANKTIAADISILPYGSKVIINGQEYIVEDTGGNVKGKHIDIYFDNHQDAINFGMMEAEVFLIVDEDE